VDLIAPDALSCDFYLATRPKFLLVVVVAAVALLLPCCRRLWPTCMMNLRHWVNLGCGATFSPLPPLQTLPL